jgi:hypothetical protein
MNRQESFGNLDFFSQTKQGFKATPRGRHSLDSRRSRLQAADWTSRRDIDPASVRSSTSAIPEAFISLLCPTSRCESAEFQLVQEGHVQEQRGTLLQYARAQPSTTHLALRPIRASQLFLQQ